MTLWPDSAWYPFRLVPLCLVFGLMMLVHGALIGEEAGTSSRKAKMAAIQSLPLQQLNQVTQTKITDVINNSSIYRRLPVSNIEVDPDHLVFLVRHPEVIVNIWRMMGVTKMKINRTGPYTVWSDDGSGTTCNIELVYGTNNLHIFYCSGTYQGNIIKRKLNGACVLVLKTQYHPGAGGKPTATNQLDVFLKIDNATVGLIARTLNPVVGPTADHNFTESLKFLQRLNQTTVTNGPGVQRMAGKLTDVKAEIRQAYSDVAGLVYRRGLQAAGQESTGYPTSMRAGTPAIQSRQPGQRMPQPDSSSYHLGDYSHPLQQTQFQVPMMGQPRANLIPSQLAIPGNVTQPTFSQGQRNTNSFHWANGSQSMRSTPASRFPSYPPRGYRGR